jgi:hypothetical protein
MLGCETKALNCDKHSFGFISFSSSRLCQKSGAWGPITFARRQLLKIQRRKMKKTATLPIERQGIQDVEIYYQSGSV